jgi:hypothetical protein
MIKVNKEVKFLNEYGTEAERADYLRQSYPCPPNQME